MPPIIKSPNSKPKPSKKKFLLYFSAVMIIAAVVTVGVIYGYVEPRKQRIKECQNGLFFKGLSCRSGCNTEEKNCLMKCDEDDSKCRFDCYSSTEVCKKDCSSKLLNEAIRCDNM